MRFDPAGYPGRPPERPTLVYDGRIWPLRASGTSLDPFEPVVGTPAAAVLEADAVRWSLAYGANADPDRLVDKGLDRRGAVVLPASARGRERAWEGRRTVSTGAVPLTLVAAPGLRLDVWLLGIHADDTDVLDASEGRGANYLLGRVGPVAVADRFLLADALAYGPAAGTEVVTIGGRPARYPELDQLGAGLLADDAAGVRLRADPLPAAHEGRWPATPLEDLPLFVYGTLQPGGRYWARVADLVEIVGPASCRGALTATPHGWPAAELIGDGEIHGTLLRAHDPDAARLLVERTDAIEDAPRLFRRRAVPVTGQPGASWALTYEWSPAQGPPPGEVLADGRWRDDVARNRT